MKLTIYTAIFGGYDRLKEPLYNSPEIDYICFSDKHMESDNWEVKVVPVESSPRREARKYKILSHEYIKRPISLWIDGSRYIKRDPIPYIKEHLKTNNFFATIHPVRDCVYTEALECLRLSKGDPDNIKAQIGKYYLEHYPQHNGMINSCVLLRRRTSKVIQLEKDWYNELNNYSVRDQLSFNYVAWKSNFKYGLFNWREITSSEDHK